MDERKHRWGQAFDLASDAYDHPTRRFFILNAAEGIWLDASALIGIGARA